jgi:hypothetical protein
MDVVVARHSTCFATERGALQAVVQAAGIPARLMTEGVEALSAQLGEGSR